MDACVTKQSAKRLDRISMRIESHAWRFVPVACAFVLTLLTAWPRWMSPGGTPYAIAFVCAVVLWVHLLVTAQARYARGASWLWAASAVLALYALSYVFVPNLLSAMLAAVALACAMFAVLPADTRARAWGLVPALLLALHAEPSLQFYLGYPLRRITGGLTALLMGFRVRPIGTALTDGIHTVSIDGPCSGMNMLSIGLLLAAFLSVLLRLRRLHTVALFATAMALIIVGNAWRASALFILETRSWPEELHAAVGIVIFAVCSMALAACAAYLSRRQVNATPPIAPALHSTDSRARWSQTVFLVLCCAALAARGLPSTNTPPAQTEIDVTWPRTWQGHALTLMQPDARSAAFQSGFPGAMAQFRVGDTGRVVLMRYCTQATRKLHPPEHCFQGSGWACVPMPPMRDELGHLWSRFEAIPPDGAPRPVRQCYVAVDGPTLPPALETIFAGANAWPDASSWYWAAALPGSTVTATLALTVLDAESGA
jgi:exosortase/archaeosortase family protein